MSSDYGSNNHDCMSKLNGRACNSLFLNCTYGARKGALTGALIDLLDEERADQFLSDFGRIGFPGISATASKEFVDGTSCSHFTVLQDGSPEAEFNKTDNTSHNKHHHGRSLSDVSYIIEELEIDGKAAQDSIGIYNVLAEAEAKAHGTFPGSVHFHEVGNDFAIASIVAFCMLINIIEPKSVSATPVTTGFGFVECAHGRIEIPAPATSNILIGIPTNVGKIEGELTTPTGAAIISYYAENYISAEELQSISADKKEYVVGCGVDRKKYGAIRAFAKVGN